jgi:cytochrome o ubiquinol oxidase subunit IV
MIDSKHGWNKSLKPLFLGFFISLVLTIAAHRIIYHHFTPFMLLFTIFGLGIVQALTQLVFFLHLGLEKKPHWTFISFLFAVVIIGIIIGGTLWIMMNLQYNVGPY